MSYDHELAVALEAVQRAGQILLAEYAHFQAIPNAPADISTHADRVSQDIILEHLHTAFPDDALCAEEATAAFAGVPQTGSRVWIVDPIDGTRGFARKNGEFSIMVALVENGRIGVGVVSEPAKERLTYARQDCFRARRIHVRHRAALVRVHAVGRRGVHIVFRLRPRGVEPHSV